MKTLAALLLFALPAAALETRVITASPEGFLVNATLIEGKKDAVLVDAAFTLADGQKIADAVKASGKNLTTIYVTHGHPDHYFGAAPILAAFPKAKLVALPSTVAEIEKTWAAKVAQWKPMYKDAIDAKPALPVALTGRTIDLEGQKLAVKGPVQGDDGENSFVWIPSARTIVASDIVFDGVHPWTANTTPAQRKQWADTLARLGKLKPVAVVPGHQSPAQKQAPSNLEFTRSYLAAFDTAVGNSKSADEALQKVKASYPDLALDVIAKLGTGAAFAQK